MTDAGTFTGIGDATPDNVGRTVSPHFIRMAETRAKARALRDALNIGAASIEEMGEQEGDDVHARVRPLRRPAAAPGGGSAPNSPAWRQVKALTGQLGDRAPRVPPDDAPPEQLQEWIARAQGLLRESAGSRA